MSINSHCSQCVSCSSCTLYSTIQCVCVCVAGERFALTVENSVPPAAAKILQVSPVLKPKLDRRRRLVLDYKLYLCIIYIQPDKLCAQ